MNPIERTAPRDIVLQSGECLASAEITYLTLGRLNEARDNAIVMPTYYTGRHSSYLPMIGPGRPLDPARYFLVLINMFGNGASSSPSNRAAALQSAPFPRVSVYDNVVQQARLVFEHLNVARIALVCGWSLGGIQAYQWAALFPDRVERLLAYGTAARTSAYNYVFLEGLKASLRADERCGAVAGHAQPDRGLRAFARVYLGWAYSREFFAKALYRELGYPDLQALFQGWDEEHLSWDARDLLAMLDTWQHADISANPVFTRQFEGALRAIRARTMLVTCSSDRYFSPLDNQYESRFVPNCEVRSLVSPFGHCAFSPGKVSAATEFLDRCLEALLAN